MGLGFAQLFSNTFVLEFCSLAFLFMVGMPFPQWIQSGITISLCYSYCPLYPLTHGKPLTLCPRTETATDTVQPCACFLSVIQPSVLREKLCLEMSKRYAKVLFPFPPKIFFFLVCWLVGWFWGFFVIEELDTRKKLPAWIKTRDD